MKINMPVTSNEYLLTETDLVVSKTDTRGVITFINDDFLRISGFTKEELIGASHNIVRHPDMPPEAFADMWAALKAGRPWTGMVKNRCKNGDFYWVMANATPIRDGGQITGYMSVRTMPSRAQVEATDSAYRKFRDGQAGNLRIQDGQVVKASRFGLRQRLARLSLKARLAGVIVLLALALITVGGAGIVGLGHSNEDLSNFYEQRMLSLGHLAELNERVDLSRNSVTQAVAKNSPPAFDSARKELIDIDKSFDAILNEETSAVRPEEHTAQLLKFSRQWQDYRKARNTVIDSALAGEETALAESQRIADERFDVAHETLRKLEKEATDGALADIASADADYRDFRNFTAGLIVLAVGLAGWLGLALIRSITRPLDTAINHFARIAEGNYSGKIEIERRDEIGRVMEALKSMQIRLGFDMAEIKRMANENRRIRIGLDNVSTGVMIADTNREIIYVNNSVVRILREAEADIRKHLPNFSADDLVGKSIDLFHKNPAHQAQMLAALNSTHRANLNIGGRTMIVTANPIINESGTRLGSVAEWLDRTAEVTLEREIADIVSAAVRGDFNRRIETEGKTGFFKQLGEGINQFIETCDTGMNDTGRMLAALARGDLTARIDASYEGTFGRLKDDSNSTAEKLAGIVAQIREATGTINAAANEIAAGNADLSQRTEEQASSLEETAASMQQLTATVKQNAENAKQANQLAKGASDIAGHGGEAVAEVVGTMDAINDSSKKIVDIIAVIDGIAFQTNILALNAAVEAARAGEQGRGFAVVAAEVRSLAQRSAAAAKEIKGLISDSVSKVENGSKLVANAGQTMEEVVLAVKRVTDIMAEIATASAEQSSGIEQVNQAITQMDQVTQQNAALVEESAAAAESMAEQARGMAELVSVFNLGHTESTETAARPAIVPRLQTKKAVLPPPKPLTIGRRGSPSQKPGAIDDDWSEF